MNYYNNSPGSPGSTPPTWEDGRERGGCLTVWLGVALFVNVVLGGIAFLQILSLYSDARVQAIVSPFLVLILGVLLVATVAGLIGIWNWKKWGVYLLAGTIIAGIFVQFGEVNFLRAYIAPLVQLGILYFLVNPKWEYFE